MKRRDFLKLAGLFPFIAATPRLVLGQEHREHGRVLVLVELAGGNDGLNTVVPYTDSTYYAARPRLAVSRDTVLPLTDSLGFNPVLEPLMDSWQTDQLAIVRGVGYASPNRSHFRSIDIWETASGSDDVLIDGWLARALGDGTLGELSAEGIVIGAADLGPLVGDGVRALVMDDTDQFIRQARQLRAAPGAPASPALAHVLAVQSDVLAAGRDMDDRMSGAPAITTPFPRHALGRQLEGAAQIIAAGVPVAVIKATHGGFDTHANQRNQHDARLTELADSLAAFRQAMVELGRWGDVLVMSYSEFGRRVGENGNRGTDHGTAAPHLVMGGRVQGGLYGAQPSLTDLEGGDLRYAVDYRSLYSTVCRDWWGVPDAFLGEGFGSLGFVAG